MPRAVIVMMNIICLGIAPWRGGQLFLCLSKHPDSLFQLDLYSFTIPFVMFAFLQLTEQKRPQNRVHQPLFIIRHFLSFHIHWRCLQVFSRGILFQLQQRQAILIMYAHQFPSLSNRFNSPQVILYLTFIFYNFIYL